MNNTSTETITRLKKEGLLSEGNRHMWELLQPARLVRMYDVLNRRTRYISVLMEAVDDPRNQSAVLRTAEAMGVQDVTFTEGQAPFQPSKLVTQNAHKWLTVRQQPDIVHAIVGLQAKGCQVWAGHLSEHAVPVEEIDLSRPAALLFGNEHSGLSAEALRHVNGTFMLPMQGFSQSINISAAASAALYQVTRKAMKELGERYVLSPEEKKRLFEDWMRKSIPPRIRKAWEKQNT